MENNSPKYAIVTSELTDLTIRFVEVHVSDLATFPRRRTILALLVIFMLVFSLFTFAGCDDKQFDPADPEARPSRPLTRDDDGNYRLEGGVAVLGVTQEPDYLDPHLAISAGTKELLFNVYEGIFKMTPKGKFARCLIDEFDYADDNLSMILHLKEFIYFHDGSRLTAEDVVWSLDRAAGRHDVDAWSTSLPNITAKVVDERTVELTMQEVDPHIFATLTVPIIKKDSTDLNDQPNGTGPFVLTDYMPQDRMIFETFSMYHGDLPYLDAVHVLILADRDVATYDLQTGQIDIFPYLGAEKIAELQDQYNMVHGSANMVQVFAFNNADPVLADPEVRKAVNSAIDRYGIIDLIGNGYGQTIYSGLSPALGEYFNEEITENDLLPLSEAKAIIAEKYPDGLTLHCKVPGNYLIHVNTGEILASQLKEINVTLDLERIDWMAWLEDVYQNRDYQTTIIALTFDEFTPRRVLERYASDAHNNFINFSNPLYDQTLELALTTTEEEQRVLAYRELQRILFEDTGSAYLQDPESITAVRNVLGGYTQYPAYVQDLSRVYFIDEAARDQSRER